MNRKTFTYLVPKSVRSEVFSVKVKETHKENRKERLFPKHKVEDQGFSIIESSVVPYKF